MMVANNAAWIEMAMSALGIGGEFTPILWQNTNDMPPIFPNADTLGGTIFEKMAAIEQLVEKRGGRVVSVKDAWAELDLTTLGFDILFRATWLYRDPHPLPHSAHRLTIEPITTPDDLDQFALACNGPDIPTAVYSPQLLNQADVVWLAAQHDHQIIAGATAVRAHGLNGINNVFGERIIHKQAVIAAAVQTFADLPACTYARDHELSSYHTLGFKSVGPLRVWLRPSSA
jgi:hypothetical protein